MALARPTTDMSYDGFRIAARLADGAPTAERCSRRARRALAPRSLQDWLNRHGAAFKCRR